MTFLYMPYSLIFDFVFVLMLCDLYILHADVVQCIILWLRVGLEDWFENLDFYVVKNLKKPLKTTVAHV